MSRYFCYLCRPIELQHAISLLAINNSPNSLKQFCCAKNPVLIQLHSSSLAIIFCSCSEKILMLLQENSFTMGSAAACTDNNCCEKIPHAVACNRFLFLPKERILVPLEFTF